MPKQKLLGIELPVPKFAIITIILLVLSFFVLIILTGSQQPDSSTRDGSIEFVIATEELTTSQDRVISVSNATLYVPKDAINMAGTISITPFPPDLFSIAEQTEWSRTLVVNVEYRNEAGTPYPLVTLSKPFHICFKVTDERWQDYLSRPDEYQVHYYNEEQEPPGWEPLPMTANPERNELCGETDHFSLFALAIKKSGSTIPITSSNPTPTPRPKSLIDILNDFLGQEDTTGGIYEP
jgi:hypothetical protein